MTLYYEQQNLIDQSISLVVKMEQSKDTFYKRLEKNYTTIEVYIKVMDKESLVNIASKCTKELVIIGNKKIFVDEIETISKLGLFHSIETIGENIKINIVMGIKYDDSKENNIKLLSQIKEENELSNTDYFIFKSVLKDANKQISQLKLENSRLKKQNEAIQKQIDEGIFDAKSEKFQLLMEKYKASNERLNNLRNSRLGKLQVKYWDYKGR